jgi:outer membrane protein OmpA-like peptidoglycan-associated protein
MRNIKETIVVLSAVSILFAQCSSLNNTQKGAGIGTAGGAAAGAVIGKAAGNTVLGAVIGGVVGGVAGGLIGKKMDKQAEEIKTELPGVKVERVDEKIVVEFSSAVLFGFDQSNLTAGALKNLEDLVVILNKYPDTDIEIQGHTDNTGSADYNQRLSRTRADNVANYLVGKGIDTSRVTSIGYSFTKPKYDNSTAEGRKQNRRVEFVITANEKMKNEAIKEAEATQ